MTKPKVYPYQIQYTDNTYRMVDWTREEFKAAGDAIKAEYSSLVLDDGIYRLTDVRAIVAIPEPEPQTDEEKEQNLLSEYGAYDQEVIAWLKSQGIDPVKGGMAE